ncbi:AAA family ATPase [Veronia pacifica]|uniref:AAA+ ATPase domain-containing protein n=1 Tax=Veronia pacifica TaxID=1080227 RepID=A0A1C3EQ81_9GAMM|nr:AAA family ATPase [Veronia pacifica]ODA35375.1 hypothetical protein A8L45_04215 [Veronia pacifica]
MYNDFFQLKESPFAIVPNPRFYYLSDRHKEALKHVLTGIADGGGLALLSGEVGTGKTMTLRALRERMTENSQVIELLNPAVSVKELMQTLCDELELPYDETDGTKRLHDLIVAKLKANDAADMQTVLLVDEAQHLLPDVLEQLRLLTNIETSERKLLKVILIGQPELLELLRQPNLRQLAQRITARYHLMPLVTEEVKEYISHRLSCAGGLDPLFEPGAIKVIAKETGGIPRLINLVCDAALKKACLQRCYRVDSKLAAKACEEVLHWQDTVSARRIPRYWPYYLGTAASAVLLGVAVNTLFERQPVQTDGATVTAIPASSNVAGQDNGQNSALNVLVNQPASPAQPAETGPPVAAQSVRQVDLTPPVEKNEGDVTAPSDTAEVAASDIEESEPQLIVTSAPDRFDGNDPLTDFDSYFEPEDTSPLADGVAMTDNGAVTDDASDVIDTPKPAPTIYEKASVPSVAIRNLYASWGVEATVVNQSCSKAVKNGLSCLKTSLTTSSLLTLNKPAVLTITENGATWYAVLEGHYRDLVALNVAGERIIRSKAWLQAHWKGQSMVLWRPPLGSARSVIYGQQGDRVKWLENMLGVKSTRSSGKFDVQLWEKVLQFQKDNNLIVDGIAGPKTLMTLVSLKEKMGPELETGRLVQDSQEDIRLASTSESSSLAALVAKAANETKPTTLPSSPSPVVTAKAPVQAVSPQTKPLADSKPTPDTDEQIGLDDLDLSSLPKELADRVELALSRDGSRTLDGKLSRVTPTPSNVSRISDLPPGVMSRMPKMNFQQHNYASDPNKRWVKVNNRKVLEGQKVAEGVVLLGIEPQQVVVQFERNLIAIPALSDR